MSQADVIHEIAEGLPERDRHVPFMKLVLGWSNFECAFGYERFADVALTEYAMHYIAAHWDVEVAS